MAVSFFTPTDPLSFTGATIQSYNNGISNTRAQGLGDDGDELAYEIYDKQASQTAVYKVFSGTASLASIAPGTVIGTNHIDSVSVRFSATDFPEITVTFHEHTECHTGMTSHGTSIRKMSLSFTSVSGAFGVPSSIPAPITVASGSAIVGATYSATIVHVDELDGNGKWLAADDRDGSETWQVDVTGTATVATSTSGWVCTNNATNNSNTTAETTSFSFEKHTTTSAPSSAE